MLHLVTSVGAFALPGVSIAYDIFLPILYRAVARGFVSQIHAYYVHQGLRWGFDLGFSPEKLPGRRYFKNYKSALEAEKEVSKNIFGRLRSKKSYSLFPFSPESFHSDLSSFLPSWCVFPMGAVPKSTEPGAFRPISDHSRTGFNDASQDEHLRHSLRSASEIAKCLGSAFHMAVHDVDAAFPLLPLSPILWPFFLFVWPAPPSDGALAEGGDLWLHWHVCGDFGAKGLPGTFKCFFSDVVVGMARSEGALTLPMPIHVDDMALIGRIKSMVDDEASSLARFLERMGTPVKESKRKAAAQVQFVIGFWWDSNLRTRTLDEKKVLEYVAMFSHCAAQSSLSLSDLQRVAGRLQRAALTLPPGAACLLANLFSLMRGLARPQSRRRVSKLAKRDLKCASNLLDLNCGRGFFSYDHFRRAPRVATDASKSSRYVGGGYFSMCGRFSWWRYGASASRHPIDALEGDAVVKAAGDLGHLWSERIVPFSIDNQSFQISAAKGWSRAQRLSELIRSLFFTSVACQCIFEFHWISTHDNVFADALSRPDPLDSFLELVSDRRDSFPSSMGAFCLRQASDAGDVRSMAPTPSHFCPKFEPPSASRPRFVARSGLGFTKIPGVITKLTAGPAFSSDCAGDGPQGAGKMPVVFSVSYPRASIYAGLPSDSIRQSVDSIISDRLSGSSHSSISAALAHWSTVALRHGWPRVIVADDPLRGGKLATFVSYLVDETELKAVSISNYVWALRAWFKIQRQPDPILGVLEWDDFMQSVAVVAWVKREPRKAVPLHVILGALESVDPNVFWEVQAALLIVFLFFTFARSESPCPKSFTGEGGFDPNKHLQVCDVEIRSFDGRAFVAVRLKSIKQDPRMERSDAPDGDWVFIGDVEGLFSVVNWLSRFWSFFPADGSSPPRPPDSPFFRDAGGERVLTYTNALRDARRLYARVIPAEEAGKLGLHGLRVEAYNRARAHDPLLAVAQGGWGSEAHERYARFKTLDVLALPSAMVAGASSTQREVVASASLVEPPPPELAVSRPSGPRLGRARTPPPSSCRALVAVSSPSCSLSMGPTPSRSLSMGPTLLSPARLPSTPRSSARRSGGRAAPSSDASARVLSRREAAQGSTPLPAPIRPPPAERDPAFRGGSRAVAFSGRYGE